MQRNGGSSIRWSAGAMEMGKRVSLHRLPACLLLAPSLLLISTPKSPGRAWPGLASRGRGRGVELMG